MIGVCSDGIKLGMSDQVGRDAVSAGTTKVSNLKLKQGPHLLEVIEEGGAGCLREPRGHVREFRHAGTAVHSAYGITQFLFECF